MNLFLNFPHFPLTIQSEDEAILSLLCNDFEYFYSSSGAESPRNKITLQLSAPPKLPPRLVAKKQTPLYLLYRDGHTKYVDYYGKVLAIEEKAMKQTTLYGQRREYLHEKAYLLILSLVGKAQDQHGMHKLHCFAVEKDGTALLGVMPMKGGKTSSFLHFLQDPHMKIISDDCPIIDRQGRIHAFPLRVGCDRREMLPEGDSDKLYTIEREQYGTKVLAPMSYFPHAIIDKPIEKAILIFGKRSTYQEPLLQPLNRFQAFTQLGEHLIAGIGLPMILEFFLKPSLTDLPFLIKLFFSRSLAAWRLTGRSKSFRLFLTSDIEKNCEAMRSISFRL